MGWGRHIPSANESTIPVLFSASDKAVQQHNQEVYGLESSIIQLEEKNKKLKSLLSRVELWDRTVDVVTEDQADELFDEIREVLKDGKNG